MVSVLTLFTTSVLNEKINSLQNHTKKIIWGERSKSINTDFIGDTKKVVWKGDRQRDANRRSFRKSEQPSSQPGLLSQKQDFTLYS